MDIAILGAIPQPLHNTHYRAVESFTHKLAAKLHARGHKVTLYSGDYDTPYTNIPLLSAKDIQKLGRLNKNAKSNLAEIEKLKTSALIKAIKRIRAARHDIVHYHGQDLLPLIAADKINTVMLTTLHAAPTPELAHLFKKMASTIHSCFFATSQNIKNAWKTINKDLEIGIIQNGMLEVKDEISLNLISPENSAIWVGDIHPKTKLHLAIESCHIAGIPLKFSGKIVDEKYYEQIIDPLLGNNDHYLGELGNRSLKSEMERAKIGIITSYQNRLSEIKQATTTLEMLATGLPIAGFYGIGLDEIIDGNNGTLSPAYDTNAMAGSISKIQEKDYCKIKIQQQTIQRHSFDTMVTSYEKAYGFLRKMNEKDRKEQAHWYLRSSQKQGTLA